MVDFQMIAFIILLTYAAIIDLRTRTIPDHIPVLIILIGLIEMEPRLSPYNGVKRKIC